VSVSDARTVVVTDPAIREGFAQDASGLHLVPEAVARPTTADEVVAVLREAHAARTPITAAGAQTSYVGGSIADRGVVLSLRAMDQVLDLDPDARTMRVQPGALLGDVKRAQRRTGCSSRPIRPARRSRRSAARSPATRAARARSSTAPRAHTCAA
jgi:FAD/FMN-containing dehydrogenase